MKKLLLLAALLICGITTSSAQLNGALTAPAGTLKKATTLSTPSTRMEVKRKAELAEGQYLVGLLAGTDDSYSTNGLGFGADITVSPGYILSNSFFGDYTNAEILGMRYALSAQGQVNSVSVDAITSSGDFGANVAKAKVSGTSSKGWNTVMFDTPVQLPTDAAGLMLSYETTLKSTDYTIAYSLTGEYFYVYGPLGQNGEVAWYSMGTDYGTPCIQLIVKADPPSQTTLDINYVLMGKCLMGEELSIPVTLIGSCTEVVTSVDYDFTIEGTTTHHTHTFTTPIPVGYYNRAEFTHTFTAPNHTGNIPCVINITKINGKDYNGEKSHFSISPISRRVDRFSVVEEFTGTGCPWCPRGWAGMELLKETMSDKCAVIAIHQYNSSDPMYVTNYQTLTYQGAPSCIIDRVSPEMDPFYGGDDKGIQANVKKYLPILPEVAISVSATLSEDKKNVNATATTEFLCDLPGSQIVFVVTADGLTGTTSSWKQYNNYASYTAAGAGVTGTMLADFCKGGKYGSSPVTLVYNDVMIGSSWYKSMTGTTNKAPGFTSTAVGNTETSNYTIALPTKTTLMRALLYDQLNVVAFVLKEDGSIANAARCHVEFPEGISNVNVNDNDNQKCYDLQGRAVKADARGLFIQGGQKILIR